MTASKGGIKEMLALALPIVLSQSCDTIMTFTDRLFLSRLGMSQMNAALGGGMAVFLLMTFFLGLVGYSTALSAQYYGAGQKKMCARANYQAWLISFAAYPILLAGGMLLCSSFSRMGIGAEQAQYQYEYASILIYGSIFSLMRSSLGSFFSAVGKGNVVLIGSFTAMVVNVLLDYLLIFGHGGLPAMGVAGSAWATIAGNACGLGVMLWMFFSPAIKREFETVRALKFDRIAMGKLLKFGSPAGFEFVLNMAAFTVLIYLFQLKSEVVATAASLMFNWDMVSFVPLIGIEIGVTSLVGRYMGAGQPDLAQRAAYSGIKVGSFYSVLVVIFFVGFPRMLVDVFAPASPDPIFDQAVPIAVYMLQIASVYVIVQAFWLSMIGALRGAGDSRWVMRASVAAHWLFVPTLYLALYVFDLSPAQGWTLLVGLFMCFCLMFYFRFRAGKWKDIKMIDQQAHDARADM